MSLVYFQGLGLIANGTTTSAADTGAFTNHKSQPRLLCPDDLCDSCTVSFPGVLTIPNPIQFNLLISYLACCGFFLSNSFSFALCKFCCDGCFLQYVELLCTTAFCFSFYSVDLPIAPVSYPNDVPDMHTTELCICLVTPGYHGAAGGPGVWALAVIFLISIIATGSFILYKFKR